MPVEKCVFCDYHLDVSFDPYKVNKEVLEQVTGEYGVLDVINSGSCVELCDRTIELLQQIVVRKKIHTLWFESHWMYRNKLEEFKGLFPGVDVKFRCGVETFDVRLRKQWCKGVPEIVTA